MSDAVAATLVKVGIDRIRPVFQQAGRQVRITPPSLALVIELNKMLTQIPGIRTVISA
jgi:hypothetical protein